MRIGTRPGVEPDNIPADLLLDPSATAASTDRALPMNARWVIVLMIGIVVAAGIGFLIGMWLGS